MHVFITELTAEVEEKTASCSDVKAHLHSGLTKPARLGTFQPPRRKQDLSANSWSKNSLHGMQTLWHFRLSSSPLQ